MSSGSTLLDLSDYEKDVCGLAFHSNNACNSDSKRNVEESQASSTLEESEIVAYRFTELL